MGISSVKQSLPPALPPEETLIIEEVKLLRKKTPGSQQETMYLDFVFALRAIQEIGRLRDQGLRDLQPTAQILLGRLYEFHQAKPEVKEWMLTQNEELRQPMRSPFSDPLGLVRLPPPEFLEACLKWNFRQNHAYSFEAEILHNVARDLGNKNVLGVALEMGMVPVKVEVHPLLQAGFIDVDVQQHLPQALLDCACVRPREAPEELAKDDEAIEAIHHSPTATHEKQPLFHFPSQNPLDTCLTKQTSSDPYLSEKGKTYIPQLAHDFANERLTADGVRGRATLTMFDLDPTLPEPAVDPMIDHLTPALQECAYKSSSQSFVQTIQETVTEYSAKAKEAAHEIAEKAKEFSRQTKGLSREYSLPLDP